MESPATFSETFPTGYYVCRLNNQKYQHCGILNEWKKVASANFEQAKIKQDDVQAIRLIYSIPESLTKNEDSSHEQESVEQKFHNGTTNKVIPYISSVDILYSFNKHYYLSSFAIHPTQSQKNTNVLKHNFNYNVIDIHNKVSSKFYHILNNRTLSNPFIIAKAMKYKSTKTLDCSSRVILDTGATRHVTGYKHLFINHICLYNKFVTLGYGLTQLPINSVGSIVVMINI